MKEISEDTPVKSTIGRVWVIITSIVVTVATAVYILTGQMFTIQNQILQTQSQIENLGFKIGDINNRMSNFTTKRDSIESDIFIAKLLTSTNLSRADEQTLRLQLRDIYNQ